MAFLEQKYRKNIWKGSKAHQAGNRMGRKKIRGREMRKENKSIKILSDKNSKNNQTKHIHIQKMPHHKSQTNK